MKRLVEAHGKILQRVNLTFQYELRYINAIPDWIFVDSFYYQPYDIVLFDALTVKSLETLKKTAYRKQPVNTTAKSIKMKTAQQRIS